MLTLPRHAAHLWYVEADAVCDADLLAAYRDLMSPDEAERQSRFRFAAGRHQYLVARALVRSVLSLYAPVAPGDWIFARNPHGKPEIAAPGTALRLRFNLSHTHGLIACLVARDREVGVDVENTQRPGETVALASRFFSKSEAEALRALPAERQRERFFDDWTLKEAYIKARGLGLSIPLEQFSFHLDALPRIRIDFTPEMRDDALCWQFFLTSPTRHHRLAAALRSSPADAPISITLRSMVPLRDSFGRE